MCPPLADVPTRAKPSLAPSPKHLFDRDPLLVPQLFVDSTPPWYRRTTTLMGIGASSIVVLGTATVLRVYGFEGVLRKIAALASR